ncbi:polymer-forming cytoskeletal protein [Dictyobacter arantiisoli]|uniref:DUF8173 domain-containing protein n=1 Tax=Dictyobacter arantiisoli TaxID=2014874 RepID=A0A5A5TGV3_9CHLR|nr:polymer-forming cytoskeletal protein [Dictyobacter arantiisoli]GCF10597.1 hypothetical protein KDI_41610 [Dictyobacter arantiisoli]
MQKVSRRQRFMLSLPGLMLLAAFLISGGVEALSTGISRASAMGVDTNSVQQPAECIGEPRKPSFRSAVVVSSGNVVCGDLTSFWGNVAINGEVKGDVMVVGGNVTINGKVNGNVTLYGGNLISQPGASVNGDIHVCGGQQVQNRGLLLHGSLFGCPTGIIDMLGSDAGSQFRLWYIVTWVVLGVLLTTLLPEHVMMVRTTVKSKLRRSVALGFLSILLAPVVFTVLIALIIPIPLAILVALGLFAAWALGTVSTGWIIGDALLQHVAPQFDTRLAQVCVGTAVLALLGSLPYIGWLVNIAVGVLGIGAVFLSHFGTRLYSQPKQPLPL